MLLGLGMCRYRSADPGPDRTAYTGRVPGDGVVWLWGFGLVYCLPHLGGIFLRRYGFDPVLVAEPQHPVHLPEHLAPFARPNTARQRATALEIVRAAAAWAAGYEHWVAETLGIAYREATLAVRNKPPAIPAKDMARAWEHLAKKSTKLADPAPTPCGPWGQLIATLRTTAGAFSSHPTRPYTLNSPKRGSRTREY